jgi:hypothetical protein
MSVALFLRKILLLETLLLIAILLFKIVFFFFYFLKINFLSTLQGQTHKRKETFSVIQREMLKAKFPFHWA